SGNQIRVNTQLVDAAIDAHVWAERFEGNTSDLFAVQDEITTRIAVALNVELIGAEATRQTGHLIALDYIFRGHALALTPGARENRVTRITMYERALALDPGSIEAQSWLAAALANVFLDNMTDTPEADISRAQALAERALAAAPLSPLAHRAQRNVLRAL